MARSSVVGPVAAVLIGLCSPGSVGAQLHGAAHRGDLDRTRQLLSSGADVNARDSKGATPLIYAAQGGHTAVVTLLLERGALPNAKANGANGITPLHVAAGQGHRETAVVLLANGADIEIKDSDGSTPLLWAVQEGKLAMTSLLLEKGADPSARNANGETALHRAINRGRSIVVETLLTRNASLNVRDGDGLTPMRLALEKGYADVLWRLRTHGGTLRGERDVIRFVQVELRNRAYGIDRIDGRRGPNTVAAVRQYQEEAGLVVDGAITISLANSLTGTAQPPVLDSTARRVQTNVFVSRYDLRNIYGWNGQGMRRNMIMPEAMTDSFSMGRDPDYGNHDHVTGHVRFGNFEVDGHLWVTSYGVVVGHASLVRIGS